MPSILSELKVLFPEYVIEFKKNAAHENEILVKWA